MAQRADLITQSSKQPDLFSDFLDDFSPHPLTGDIVRVRNENSIRQSVKNIILTNIGERLFQPFIGSNINLALFEPNDQVLVNELMYHIQTAISNYEPRVAINNIALLPATDNNDVSLNIVYTIINSQTPQSLGLILRRTR